MKRAPAIAVVTRETRLQGLLARWGTIGAAKFRLRAAHAHERLLRTAAAGHDVDATGEVTDAALADAEFDAYAREDEAYRASLDRLQEELDLGFPVTHVSRDFLANYDFRNCLVVVVVGQDGLVANAAKYVGDVPIIAVNPDPQRIDGILLPFRVAGLRPAIHRVLQGTASLREVTLAEAELNDGQRLLAFNDLFVGCGSHASARYTLRVGNVAEPQSSSGIIISTGAGSTGWLSSMFNMYAGFRHWLGNLGLSTLQESQTPHQDRELDWNLGWNLSWDDLRLAWVVREPFRSKQTGVSLVAGLLEDGQELVIESLMPSRGVVFSDGVETDFLEFNSGSIARVRRSVQRARLVVGA